MQMDYIKGKKFQAPQAIIARQPKLFCKRRSQTVYRTALPTNYEQVLVEIMVRAIGLLCLALMCGHQFVFAAAVMASATPDSPSDKNLPRRALMSASANQVVPAAAWTLALAGLHVVQAVSEGKSLVRRSQ
jgi:hypothetical protein